MNLVVTQSLIFNLLLIPLYPGAPVLLELPGGGYGGGGGGVRSTAAGTGGQQHGSCHSTLRGNTTGNYIADICIMVYAHADA